MYIVQDYFPAVKMKAANTSETLAVTYQTAHGRIPGDSNLMVLTAFGTDNYVNICKGIRFPRGNNEFVLPSAPRNAQASWNWLSESQPRKSPWGVMRRTVQTKMGEEAGSSDTIYLCTCQVN
jgi:hypothetical protein